MVARHLVVLLTVLVYFFSFFCIYPTIATIVLVNKDVYNIIPLFRKAASQIEPRGTESAVRPRAGPGQSSDSKKHFGIL